MSRARAGASGVASKGHQRGTMSVPCVVLVLPVLILILQELDACRVQQWSRNMMRSLRSQDYALV